MSGYYNRNNRGITKKLGPVTAYADAVLAGYTGTREQWAQDMAKLGQNVTQVAQNTKLTTELAEQTRVNTEQVAKDTADVRRLADETSDNAVQVASNTAESNRLAKETKQAAAQAKTDAEYAGAAADNFRVDTTLSEEGKAAEAKTVGEKFAKLSEDTVDINESLNQPLDVEFSVSSGSEHSSKKDQVSVTCKKGQKYFVTVETSTDNCGGISVFECANGNYTSAYTVTPNVENEFVALTDFDSLGLYIIGNTEDCTYNFHCETEDTVSGKRIDEIKNTINAQLKPFITYVGKYDIEQGTWENGVGYGWETLRLKSMNYYKVEKGSVVSYIPNGLYALIAVYENALSDKTQTPIESSGWIGGTENREYRIANSGYATVIFANGANYSQSTPISPKDYKSEMFFYHNPLTSLPFDEARAYLNQPLDVKFTLGQGAEHSSKNDQISVTCKKGQKYFVTVETSTDNCGGISVFEYANGNYTSAYTVTPNVENEFVALTDFDSLGLYIFGNTEDCTYNFHCETEDTVSPRRMAYLNKKLNNTGVENEEKELPDYWTEHLTDKILSVNNITSSCAIHGDSFIFFTDYHLEQSSGYSHLLMRNIVDQTSVDKVVFGGDIFNGSETHDGAMEKINEYLKRFKPLNVYGVRGNHEYNWNDGGSIAEQLSDSEIYNVLLKGVERNVKTNGGLSCYLDNENQKIRYILMDSHYETDNDIIPQSECEWLQERMLELESDWTVVVFTHIMFSMTYAGSQSGSVSYYTNGQRIVDAISDIKDEMKATLACVICGHVHYDYSNTDNGYLIITTTCDSKQDSGQWIGWGQGGGTIKEHAFDVFSINTVNRTIKTVRVGRGEDREWNY